MKITFYIVSVIFILAGGLFFLQGMRVLPSAVMYGKPEWIVIGGVMVICGAAIIFFQARKPKA